MGDFNQNIAVSETYEPPKELNEHAHVKSMNEYEAMWKASIEDPENFWGEMAKQFYWQTPFEKVGPEFNFDRSQGPISVKWFHGGKTNLSYNCLDRNIEQGQGSRIAFYHECNDLEDQHASFTYDSCLQDLIFPFFLFRWGAGGECSVFWAPREKSKKWKALTLPETNIAPANRSSQKETSIPTIHFQVPC